MFWYGGCCIQDDDFICIVGSNGSGKTTLVMTILKLIPPLAGKLEYYNLRPAEIGYMPQLNKLALDFPATVYEIIESGTLANQRQAKDISRVLEQFNLRKLKNQDSKLAYL